MSKRLIGVGLVLALVLGLAGCKSIEEKIGEEIGEEIVGGAIGGDVEVDGDTVTIETEDGDVTIANDTGELPEEFPRDFPLYDDYALDSASSIGGGDSTTFYVNMTSKDEVADIYEWYKAEFEDDEWEITGDVNYSDASSSTAMITAKKGEMEATVSMTSETKGTTFGVILVVKG